MFLILATFILVIIMLIFTNLVHHEQEDEWL